VVLRPARALNHWGGGGQSALHSAGASAHALPMSISFQLGS
jgi:hypothetical protein